MTATKMTATKIPKQDVNLRQKCILFADLKLWSFLCPKKEYLLRVLIKVHLKLQVTSKPCKPTYNFWTHSYLGDRTHVSIEIKYWQRKAKYHVKTP